MGEYALNSHAKSKKHASISSLRSIVPVLTIGEAFILATSIVINKDELTIPTPPTPPETVAERLTAHSHMYDNSVPTAGVCAMEAKQNLELGDGSEYAPARDQETVKEVDQEISNIDSVEVADLDLPPNLDTEGILQKMHCKNVVTPNQGEKNSLLSRIDITRYLKFCKKEYNKIAGILNQAQPDPKKRFKEKELLKFFGNINKYYTSDEFNMARIKLFEYETRETEVYVGIGWELSVQIRKYVLYERAHMLLSSRSPGSETLLSPMQNELEILAAIRDQVQNCIVCENDEEDVDWIRCYNCRGWLHRMCAGLYNCIELGKCQERDAELFECEDCIENG